MYTSKRWLITALAVALMLLVSASASAQDTLNGELSLGQPVIVQIEPAGSIQHGYTIMQPSLVTLEAFGDGAQPTLRFLRDGVVIAEEPNLAGQSIVTLTSLLDSGVYTVETGTRNAAASTVMLVIQGEVPVTATPLVAGASVSGEVSGSTPVALYSFTALNQPAYLLIDSLVPERGLNARLIETTSGTEAAAVDASLSGARLSFPAGSQNYRLEIAHGGGDQVEGFTVCFVSATSRDCQPATVAAQPQADTACRITPNSVNGANLRQTASTNAPVIIGIPSSESALVNGITADGAFYSAVYGNWSGWVAAIAVTPSGNCGSLAVLIAPALPAPTSVPPSPVPPTAVPAQPTQAPTPVLGPCHVHFTADERIYTRPVIDTAYLFDQVSATGEIIPVARWQDDPSWWKTNYSGWWLNAPGTAGEVRGDCSSLPLVAWP